MTAKIHAALLYALVAVAALSYIIATAPDTVIAISFVALVVLLPIFFVNAEYGVIVLLIIRPIIDAFSSYSINFFDRFGLNLNALLALFVCAWAITVFAREQLHWRKITGRWWLLAFLFFAFLSLFVSIDPLISLSEWLRLLSVAVIFIVAQHLARHDQHFIVWIINAAALSAVVPLLIGFYQLLTFGGLSFGGLENRIYGTFGHPNVLGFYLVMVISVVLIKHITTKKQSRSLLYPLVIAFGILALLFTYTRGAWLGLAIVLITIALARYRKPLFITAAAVCIVIVFGQVINRIFIDTFHINLNANPVISRFTVRSEEADSLAWRLRVIETMAPRILERPLLGVGIGNFVTLHQQGDIGLFEDPEAHNDYLRLAIEIGIPGLLIYLGFWITILFNAIRNFRSWPKTAWQNAYSVALIGMILAFLGMSLGDNLLQGTPVMWLVMIIAGNFVTLQKQQNA